MLGSFQSNNKVILNTENMPDQETPSRGPVRKRTIALHGVKWINVNKMKMEMNE